MVKFFVFKYRIPRIHIGLCQCDLLSLFQGNIRGRISVFGICLVIIRFLNGDNSGSQTQSLHCLLGAGAHLFQKPFVGQNRARFQLQDNHSLVAVNILYKVARFIDFYNQIPQYRFAIFPDIIRICLHNLLAVVISSIQRSNPAFCIIRNLHLRVHTQDQRACFCQGRAICRRGLTTGQKGRRQNSQGRYRRQKCSSFHIDCSSR